MITRQDVESKTNLRFRAEVGGKVYNAIQSGKVETWKGRPNSFKVPVQYGYAAFCIDNLADGENNAHLWELV